MASFVHCMKCYCSPSAEVKFFFSSCGHVACVNCTRKGCFSKNCSVCQKENPRVVEINRNLSPELADMFTLFGDSLTKFAKDLGNLIDFHASQRNHLWKYLQNRSDNFGKLQSYVQAEMKKKEQYKMQMLKLMEWKTQAEKIFLAMREKEKQTQARIQQQKGDTTVDFSNMTHDPFRTPAPPGTNRSFVTSTPIVPRTVNQTLQTTFGTSMMDASMSFTSATGIPRNFALDSSGDVSLLANRTAQVKLANTSAMVTPQMIRNTSSNSVNEVPRELAKNSTSSDGSGKKRCGPPAGEKEAKVVRKEGAALPVDAAFAGFHFSATQRTPANNARLNFMSRTEPLPPK